MKSFIALAWLICIVLVATACVSSARVDCDGRLVPINRPVDSSAVPMPGPAPTKKRAR